MKERKFEKVTEWLDYDTGKYQSMGYYFVSIILSILIGIFLGWLIIPMWWTNKVLNYYERNNKVYWREIK